MASYLGENEPAGSLAFWERKIGPFYDAAALFHIAALDLSEVEVCEKWGDVIAVAIKGLEYKLYPGFQFGPNGELLPGLRRVICILRPGLVDNWDISLWLNHHTMLFNGESATALLRQGRIDAVLDAASQDLARWNPKAASGQCGASN
ncbi:hypothetical protein [Homoserinimonas hongtaonis]|uniref:hypothetical protein n=1 Tax=Homoserinimonas hongtaonis TaxID=2079791 RepID=UPI0011B1F908|nr:hypothetical protein [Salinibacterium hongtaonis]